MATTGQLENSFAVYFDEIERCRRGSAYWALLHVLVSLPDICAALEDTGWAKPEKYVDWCRRYCPTGSVSQMTAEDYRQVRDIVLHQGRTVTTTGRFYKFTRPTASGHRVHRYIQGADVLVLDIDELATEMINSIRAWFADLQKPDAVVRRSNVARNLPHLVIVQDQELPATEGPTYSVTYTCTSTGVFVKRI